MADPATNTAYPASIEVLPEIGSGARMIDPAVRHDVMHDKLHATVNALQAFIGAAGEDNPQTVLARISALQAGGIVVSCGSKSAAAAVIPVGTEVSGFAPVDYTLVGWQLWCYPPGTLEIDVRRDALANAPPGPGDSITGAHRPAIEEAFTASGDVAGWNPSIAALDAVTAVVSQSSGVKWFALLLIGIKQ